MNKVVVRYKTKPSYPSTGDVERRQPLPIYDHVRSWSFIEQQLFSLDWAKFVDGGFCILR